jgi:TPP-dependent pyruvate/acetoin dehydrogenase alpha subunit|tara:strand:+ start:708 stop:1001 length:294 start_codon:yes stop_codon:yes gene_type:complete
MPRYHNINGTRVQFTEAEETARDNVEAAYANKAFDRALETLRSKRNNLLIETDWYANSDVNMSDDMKTYRQDLRDITNGLTTVEEVQAVIFPEKPSE